MALEVLAKRLLPIWPGFGNWLLDQDYLLLCSLLAIRLARRGLTHRLRPVTVVRSWIIGCTLGIRGGDLVVVAPFVPILPIQSGACLIRSIILRVL